MLFPPYTALPLAHSHAALQAPVIDSEGEGCPPALLLSLLNYHSLCLTYLTRLSPCLGQLGVCWERRSCAWGSHTPVLAVWEVHPKSWGGSLGAQ